MKNGKLKSLSHSEIIGFDDEYININITKFKKCSYCLCASIGYILTGLFVGWSSKILFLHDQSKEFGDFTRDEISWIVSIFPLAIFLTSICLDQIYYCLGTKILLLIASFSIVFAWMLPIFFIQMDYQILLIHRAIGGFGSGIILVLVPLYIKQVGGFIFDTAMVDLLIVQFGLGIFIQYSLDSLPYVQTSIVSLVIASVYFIICCLIPESPSYKIYCDFKQSQNLDIEKEKKLKTLLKESNLERKSTKDFFIELKKSKLLSLIGLVMIEQLVGGISILFYIKYFAQLTGGTLSTDWISTTIGLIVMISVPVAKMTKITNKWPIKKQITISSIAIIVCMTALAILCIVEGVTGQKILNVMRPFVPLPLYATVTFCHVAGITRNLWILIHSIFKCFSLDLHLRVTCTALSWLIIFGITKILPKLLYLVGVGYFYGYSVIFMIITLKILQNFLPETIDTIHEKNISNSSIESNSRSSNSLCNEIYEI